MKLSFYGAARTVTGSLHYIDAGGSTVILDCGMYQGPRLESHERNKKMPEKAVKAAACLLSHAHIDHSGSIPYLVKRGFQGSIFCTRATADLLRVMLLDSANIQERDLEFLQKRGVPAVEPIYNIDDVEEALKKLVPMRYGSWFEAAPGIRAKFLDAGHILGSAVTLVEATEGSKTRNICFTGDLGRRGMPILRDPEALPACDVVLTESTYGDRTHPSGHETEEALAAILREQAARRGPIIVPAFSLGRTQNLVYALYRIFKRGDAPRMPVFVDSPLSSKVTRIVSQHRDCFDDEALAVLGADGAPFYFPEIRYIESVDESKALNERNGAFIVLSASGMCENGRILHHLKNHIYKPSAMVLLVGYQAQGTLGRRIHDGAPLVRIYGEEIEVKARVQVLPAMSAHADRNDLMHYLSPVARSCGQIFVVHGEPQAAVSLGDAMRGMGCAQVEVPSPGESFDVV